MHTHTPGPWRAERDPRGDFRIVYNDKGNWLAEVHSDGEPEVAEADARLIAAAPELLAALKRAKDAIEFYGLDDFDSTSEEELEAIDAAITKAEVSP
jgi:hypothetical protein